ncbi:MAG: hypothetical protein IJT73_08280 [Selenomonadaceae bacterium]|nr:hypothetical protein [Selenomonadaceae bacterium]
MKTILKFLTAVIVFVFSSSAAFAADMYPETLDDGNLILVDGGMGVGRYADKKSVAVRVYRPPFYQIDIDIVSVIFSNDYFRDNGNYIGSPYNYSDSYALHLKYNWDTKTIFTKNEKGIWKNWDINHSYSHAEGNPLVPNAAEVAFFAAYGMKFFGNMRNADGYSVVSDNVYNAL